MVGENIRKFAFWGMDYLKGNHFNKHIKDLETYFNTPDLVKELLEDRKIKFLKHATSTTKFYKEYKGLSLDKFPVITKNKVREKYNDFLSNSFNKGDLVKVSTSGSYGTPFTFCLSKEKRARQQAEIIFFNKWAGYEVGMKHAYINFACNKSKTKLKIQNEVLMQSNVIDISWLEDQRSMLKQSNIELLIGYPSVINTLAEYCKYKNDNKKDFNLKCIITISETLYDDIRLNIKSVFGADLFSRYATVETGVIAHECATNGKFHCNSASYVIEVLDLDKDESVTPGQVGRVVVTDLFSHAMPLIRYETGDLAVLSDSECSCGCNTQVFDRVEGRIIESIYNTRGERMYSVVISRTMTEVGKKIDGILQYQFIQKNLLNCDLKLSVLPSYNKDSESMIVEQFKSVLGKDVNINIKYVSDIPPLKSGKRPYIISEYYPIADKLTVREK